MPDGPAQEEQSLLTFLDKVESEGKLWRDSVDNERWDRYARLFHAARPLAGVRSQKFLANLIRPTIDRRNALLTENKPGIQIMPERNGFTATAEVLQSAAEAGWHAYDIEGAIDEMVQLASVFGSSFIGENYNNNARFGLGDLEFPVYDPRACIVDPQVRHPRDIDKAIYVRVETVRNLWEVQQEYPGRGMLVHPDKALSSTTNIKTPSQATGLLQRIAGSFKELRARLQEGPVPRVRLCEYWVRDYSKNGDGTLRFPRGRHIIRGGDVILQDGPNPYYDGLWPLDWLDISPDLQSPWGRSEVAGLEVIQDAVNRIGTLFVENSILGGNLVVLADSDALSNTAINQLTNAAALFVPKKFGRNVEWRPPQPMPPHMMQFVQFGMRIIDYLVGMNDGNMEGRGRVEMRSGIQLEGLQSAAQTLIRASAKRIEHFLERFGRKYISRIFQFYTDDRLLNFIGPGDEWTQYQFESAKLRADIERQARADLGANASQAEQTAKIKELMQDAWKHFAFKIQPLSTLAATKIARAQLLKELVMGGLFPRLQLLKELGFDNAKDLLAQVQKENQEYGSLQPPPKSSSKQQGGGRSKAA